jgi:hypothetical protein
MSFAVTATSKALAAAGIDHIVTEGGRILVEAAYDGDKMVPALIRVTKQGKTYIAKRSKKKLVKFRDYCRALMKARREAGYSETEKKLREKLGSKAGHVRPKQSKSAKKAWKSSPKLAKIHKKHLENEKASKKAIKSVIKKSKAAGKKVVKKTASKKVAPKKVAGKRKFA